MTGNNTKKKMTAGMITIVILIFSLTVTTAALAYASATLDQNEFGTGYVLINLNDGEPVINQDDCAFEPGITVERDFTLSNSGTCPVWFRFWFDVVSDESDMAKVIYVSVMDGDTELFSGKMSEMTKDCVPSFAPISEAPLAIGETRTLTLLFHMDKNADGDMANASLQFDFVADAVQTVHNDGREFND